MQALFRALMLLVLITGMAYSAAWARDQQFSPPLPPDMTPQWAPIPGAPGVQHAPNTNTDLFRYGQRYYYQHDGKWYQARNIAGPWQRIQDVPRSFRQIQANYFRQPPGWAAPRSPLPPDITPQWTPIPGAPGVHYAPNTNTDLFRYGQRYYYQHDGKWYQARNTAGPWQKVQDVPRSFRQIEAPYFKQPPGWAKGKKTGWGETPMPPGQMKKHEEGQHMPPGQMKKDEEGQHMPPGQMKKSDR
ncbi:MAG: hypothetical protein ACYDIC_03655 [Desulfobaccales bacterium]